MRARSDLKPLVLRHTPMKSIADFLHRADVRLRGSRLIERKIEELDLTYLLPTHSLLGRLIHLNGMYEEHIVNWIIARQAEFAGAVMIDVGANIGWYTALFARLASSSGQVFAFEPDPDNFSVLQRTLSLNGLAPNLVQAAVGDRPGRGTLNLGHHSNPGSHSMLRGLYTEGQVEVPIVTLDDIVLPDLGDRRVALIKMDIEGFEPFALAGGEGVLARTDRIILEYSPDLMQRANVDPASLLDLADRHGFHYAMFDAAADPIPIKRADLLGPNRQQCDLLLHRVN